MCVSMCLFAALDVSIFSEVHFYGYFYTCALCTFYICFEIVSDCPEQHDEGHDYRKD